jgi:hypothetical protein
LGCAALALSVRDAADNNNSLRITECKDTKISEKRKVNSEKNTITAQFLMLRSYFLFLIRTFAP